MIGYRPAVLHIRRIAPRKGCPGDPVSSPKNASTQITLPEGHHAGDVRAFHPCDVVAVPVRCTGELAAELRAGVEVAARQCRKGERCPGSDDGEQGEEGQARLGRARPGERSL